MKYIVTLIFVAASLFASPKMEKLIIAGPVATVSHPFFYMLEKGALDDVAKKVEFRLWKNPDELRAILLKNEAHFVAIPTNVAANLHNRGVELQLVNVPIWGILDIITRDSSIKHIEDLKGKEIVVPFRADMPDIVLQALIQKAGLDPKKDFTLRYTPTPPDAMQMLILRRADNVLLAEPATSMAMRKTGSYPLKLIAPQLHVSVNLQKEWGRLFETDARIPQAAIAAVGKIDATIIDRFNAEYAKAVELYKQNPQKSARLVVEQIDFFNQDAVADSIANVQIEAKTALESKEELYRFFEILHEIEPRLIGNKLPNESLIYKGK
jgi:NitT/TauT family transport system substrate-binding protein